MSIGEFRTLGRSLFQIDITAATSRGSSGPRIDIPENGPKPHKALHYPKLYSGEEESTFLQPLYVSKLVLSESGKNVESGLLIQDRRDSESMLPVNINFKNDLSAARKMRLPWWALLCIALVSALSAALLDHFGRLNLALPILNSIATIGFLVALKWKLRRYVWFWITVSIMAALHVPLIMFIPRTTKWVPAVAIAAIDSVVFCAMLAILLVVGKFMGGTDSLS